MGSARRGFGRGSSPAAVFLAVVCAAMIHELMVSAAPVQAGRLDRARKEIRSGGARESDTSDKGSSGDGDEDGDDGRKHEPRRKDRREEHESDDELLLDIILAPFRIPYLLVEAPYRRDFGFASHPYRNPGGGYLETPERSRSAVLDDMAVNLSTDASYQYDGVWRGALSARLMVWRLELDTTWRIYLEGDEKQETDSAILGNAHLCYRFAQNRYLQFRAGAGYQHWIDGEGSEYGIDFTYGFDIFPRKPLIVSVDLGVGTVGDAMVWRGRGTLGANLGPLELYAGYEHIDIGGVPLGGPVLGARAWF